MRYMGKIYVSDVMDQIVVSGYVFDTDEWTNPDHETSEFTWQIPGVGRSDALEWLSDALSRAVLNVTTAPPSRRTGPPAIGGPYTISETGDRPI